jgi:hypothetical protein
VELVGSVARKGVGNLSIITATPHGWTRSDQWRPADNAQTDGSREPRAYPRTDVPPDSVKWSRHDRSAIMTSDRFEELATELLAMLTILVEDKRANAEPGDPGGVAVADGFGEDVADTDLDDRPVTDTLSLESHTQADQTGGDAAVSSTTEPVAEQTFSGVSLTGDPRQPVTPDADQPSAAADVQVNQSQSVNVLHVGCGAYDRNKLPPVFQENRWREIRLDIDPAVSPDFVASLTNMEIIADGTIEAVYSSHNIEHLYPHEVPLALREMHRVLNSTGFALIKLPDLQEVAYHIAQGNLEQSLYTSPMGAISPLDILYGHRASLEAGNVYMSHRTGFTGGTLGSALIKAGFAAVMVQRNQSTFSLAAVAFRKMPGTEQIARAQALILPDPGLPAVLYTRAV